MLIVSYWRDVVPRLPPHPPYTKLKYYLVDQSEAEERRNPYISYVPLVELTPAAQKPILAAGASPVVA